MFLCQMVHFLCFITYLLHVHVICLYVAIMFYVCLSRLNKNLLTCIPYMNFVRMRSKFGRFLLMQLCGSKDDRPWKWNSYWEWESHSRGHLMRIPWEWENIESILGIPKKYYLRGITQTSETSS